MSVYIEPVTELIEIMLNLNMQETERFTHKKNVVSSAYKILVQYCKDFGMSFMKI